MIFDPKTAVILQPEPYWNGVVRKALDEAGFTVADAGTAVAALALAAESYHQLFIIDSQAAIAAERELGGNTGHPGDPALKWFRHLHPVDESQLLVLTGPKGDEHRLPPHRYWPGATGWIDRSRGVAWVASRIQSIIAECLAQSPRQWRSPDSLNVGVRMALGGTLTGISETGLAVRAPLFAPKPMGGFECEADLFKAVGVRMPRAFLAESERLPDPDSADRMPQATLRFQAIGWTEAERARLRSWMIQNRLKGVES